MEQTEEQIEYRSASGVPVGAASQGSGRLKAQMDIMAERLDQRAEFGDAADDALEPSEWIARVVKHTGRAVSLDPQEFRREMVIVGALALAAIESFDRKFGGSA